MNTETAAHRGCRTALRCAAPLVPALVLSGCSTNPPTSWVDFWGGIGLVAAMAAAAGIVARSRR